MRGDVEAEASRLEALAADLRRLAASGTPSVEELSEAPLLEAWAVTSRPVMCLVGAVTGHPLLDSPFCRTSDLWAFAPTLGWARTLNRLYRLGAPRAPMPVVPPPADEPCSLDLR
ncbi:DUF6634 family protein [Pseudoroseomonas ludipueritiae]|uniref:Uncharacterized protein n=1 Tax=Pseudoroseomonas ludipueritiae TaxID=198093 RepID=A0ABR7RCC1_9PROT|nr:DUF6634 family protein [Pseudoroseomonas ludipueritiae]MBC9179484.1 hypothetical protein [Pseudoroseomonas ludipueritiae]